MQPDAGLTLHLVTLTAACAVVGGLAVWRRLPPSLLWIAIVTRFGIPLLYFGFWWDGTWTLVDDVTYFRQGQTLLSRGVDPLGFFLDRGAITWLAFDSQGNHILYGWFNLLALWTAGPYYYAPVLLNVALTFWAARWLFDIVHRAWMTPPYAAAVTGLFLLHWDVIAWSSFVNMKDTLVLLMTVLLTRAYLRLGSAGRGVALTQLVVVSFVLLWLRFYVPLVMAGCFAVASALGDASRLRRRLLAMVLGLGAVFGIAAVLGPDLLALAWSRLDYSTGSLIVGAARIVLTPQPWSVSVENGFLLLPSILHLVMLPATVVGLILLWRELPGARLPVLYAVVTLFIFAIFPLQLGPRHRYQVVFVTCWAQMHALWHLALALRAGRQRSGVLGVPSHA